MPALKREKTDYKGVYSITGTNPVTGKAEEIFYILYRKKGRLIDEKAGRAGKPDRMTAYRASLLRAARIQGALSNAEQRAAKRAAKGRMTITKLWETYETHRVRKKGLAADRIRFHLHIEPALGDKVPEDVDPLSLDRFRDRLKKTLSSRSKKPLSPTTVHHTMALLRSLVNFGVLRRLTKGFPCKVPVPPMPPNMKTEDLTEDQIAALTKALDEDIDQDAADVFRLALYTSARRAEILKARWDDVDLGRGVWILRDRKDYRDAGFPLSAPAREVLKRRLDNRKDEKNPFVFSGRGKNKDGYLKDPRAAMDRIRAAAKLPAGFRPLHGLRHTFASALVSSGVDLYVVSKLLGHSDPTLTSKRYAHLRPGVMSEAAELVGRLVKDAVAKAEAREKQEKNGTA